MPKIFQADIQVAMTVYINANTEAEARAIVEGLKENGIELPTGDVFGDFDGEITNAMISADLPEISFSPAVTIKGAYDPAYLELSYDSDQDPDYEPDEDEEYEGAVEASNAPERFDD